MNKTEPKFINKFGLSDPKNGEERDYTLQQTLNNYAKFSGL